MYNSLKNMPSFISQLIRFAVGSHIVSFTFFAPPFFNFLSFFLEEICSDSVDLILVIDFESFILNRLNCYAEI